MDTFIAVHRAIADGSSSFVHVTICTCFFDNWVSSSKIQYLSFEPHDPYFLAVTFMFVVSVMVYPLTMNLFIFLHYQIFFHFHENRLGEFWEANSVYCWISCILGTLPFSDIDVVDRIIFGQGVQEALCNTASMFIQSKLGHSLCLIT